MILSRGRRYIFIHTPKTGGTSLALALEARAMADDILLGDTPKAMRRRSRVKGMTASGRLWKHSMLTDLYGLVTQDEIEDFFVFTLVRNPWDRMVSYYHWLQAQSFEHPAVGLAKSLGFSDFLRAPVIAAGMRDFPYTRYVTDAGGVDRADLYIRLEHIAEDIAPLERHLGFGLGEIPRENAAIRVKDYRHYYSDADADYVRQACETDILKFSYRFG